MERIIVKVQVSLYQTDPLKQMLIYDKDHKVMLQTALTPDVQKEMDGSLKKFFYANVDFNSHHINLDGEAPYQPW